MRIVSLAVGTGYPIGEDQVLYCWCQNIAGLVRIHRTDGPAVTYVHLPSNLRRKTHWLNGVCKGDWLDSITQDC